MSSSPSAIITKGHRAMFRSASIQLTILTAWLLVAAVVTHAAEPTLRDPDSRFEISLFASAPQIVNPVGVQVDAAGRVYVIESHTHFRPKNYAGPLKDRLLVLEDSDRDGKADKTTVFHEGFQASMDLALHKSGDLFVAERSAIHLLRDTNKDLKADEDTVLVKLETAGNYPHNGLSGLAFDHGDGMYFGLGENLGAAYKLIGKDGTALSGEAEGGSVYHIRRDGTHLRRIATGVWNPFGICVDQSGNLFATDNDPDSSPPCRLLHVVPGGNYGYEFRYGRSGLHPFQCWNGELPGTLPMVTGIGEAPCEIVPWNNGLLIASWADNRLEHYTLARQGLSYSAQQKVVVSGDLNFRPVGIAIGADGALYVSDWASASYELPGTGRIWKLKPKQPQVAEEQRPNAFAAQRTNWLSNAKVANPQLAEAFRDSDPFVRALAVEVAAEQIKQNAELSWEVDLSPESKPLLVVAQKLAGRHPRLIKTYLADQDPQVRIAALKWIADERLSQDRDAVLAGLKSPGLTHALLAAHLATLERLDSAKVAGSLPKAELVLPILNDAQQSAQVRSLALMLLPPDHAALSSDKLRELLAVGDETLSLEVVRTMLAARHAERIKLLAELANDAAQPLALRAAALSGLAGSGEYKARLLSYATGDQPALRVEALRSLVDMPLDEKDREQLQALGDLPEAQRLLSTETKPETPVTDIAAWLKRLPSAGDVESGRRIFFHGKVGYCARCHRYEGRGQQVGPDLTRISERATREWLLTAILQPSRDVAPAYRQWQIETTGGQQLIGLSLRKGSHQEDYLGVDGKPFSIKLDQIEERRELPLSMMPAGFEHQLTPQELSDLLAFLLKKP
ncbi:MAG TPA: PVC-type heme-binding CxxCH protein [Pirellulaceae bacterium]|nr:PVC-type heme-binding CxxCH protein [Pirellulaceae bacterium]